LLALAYWAVEQQGWGKTHGKAWVYPWLVFGSNAIVAYMFSELLPDGLGSIHFMADGHRTNPLAWLFDHTFAHIPDPGWGAFAFSVTFLAVCFIPVWFLYRKRIFVKI
jgi:predicted acyltransferase